MPVLRCDACSATVAHTGKSLAFPCPGCGGIDPPRLHVDRHHVVGRNGNGVTIDVAHSGAARRERARRAVSRQEEYYGI